MSADDQREHEQKLAKIAARQAAFERSPFWFTVWDWTTGFLQVVFWFGFWLIVAQCTCDGCITKH